MRGPPAPPRAATAPVTPMGASSPTAGDCPHPHPSVTPDRPQLWDCGQAPRDVPDQGAGENSSFLRKKTQIDSHLGEAMETCWDHVTACVTCHPGVYCPKTPLYIPWSPSGKRERSPPVSVTHFLKQAEAFPEKQHSSRPVPPTGVLSLNLAPRPFLALQGTPPCLGSGPGQHWPALTCPDTAPGAEGLAPPALFLSVLGSHTSHCLVLSETFFLCYFFVLTSPPLRLINSFIPQAVAKSTSNISLWRTR